MKVRLLHAWKIWPIGHVIPDMPPNVASLLIHKGIAEEVSDAPESRMSKVLSIPNRMVASAPVKRR